MTLLAKLSRPRIAGVRPRDRLFARLDACREQGAAVWISGPPGAGKTTLVTSYVEARSLRTLWFQVDGGDTDPASFFHHLALGARQAGLPRKVLLPPPTRDHLADVSAFSRRWFRALFAGLPQPCALVLDNVHEALEQPPLAGILHDAIAEIPPDAFAIFASRGAAPPSLARAQLSLRLADIGADELRLTEDEALQVAASVRGRRGADVASLLARSEGWAAGLTLLLAHGDAGAAVLAGSLAPPSSAALFAYFASELFDRIAADARDVLLRTALLPWIGADAAQALSGNEQAPQLLEGLWRRRLFVEKHAGPALRYQVHSLLREFLVDRLAQAAAPAERSRLALASARWLASTGQAGAAVKLYIQAGDPSAARRLVLEQAADLASQGRLQTLAEWIAALPDGSTRGEPWLDYWLGVCELAHRPAAAREHWTRGYECFDAAGDSIGAMACAAGVLESHLIEFRAFTAMDPWIERLLQRLRGASAFADPGLELAVLGSLIAATVQRGIDTGRLAGYADRALALLDVVDDVNPRIAGAVRLLQYGVFMAAPEFGSALIERLRPQLADARLAPIHVINAFVYQAMYFGLVRYDEARATAATQAALDAMQRAGLDHLAMVLHARAAKVRLDAGDVDGAAAHLAQAAPTADARRFDVAWHLALRGCVALLRGHAGAAVQGARAFVDANVGGGNLRAQGMALVFLANALIEAGDLAAAHQALAQLRAPGVLITPIGHFSAALAETDAHLAAADAAAAEAALRGALAIGREHELLNTLQWLPARMSRQCAWALVCDIESGYVRRLIAARRLPPPDPDAPGWPWPVRICCLGRFEIAVDEQPLRFEGKAQRKPLALLKALVALGGREVAQDRLIEVVWPEPAEGDDQKTFDITLHRLRKLLGDDKAIRVGDRRLTLDPERVWVDLWSLERCLAAAQAIGTQPDAAALERALPDVLRLCRGALLGGEPDAAWLLPARHRVASRIQRFVAQLGGHWEAHGEWDRAAQLYERAIELDALAEAAYTRLMVCLREQGRRAEAVEVFRRCRQVLSVTLGMKPSQATQDIYETLIRG